MNAITPTSPEAANLFATPAVTKTEVLLAVLRREWLTPLEAASKVGVFALSQRCGQFRREGWHVEDKWVKTPSGARVKSYHVVGKRNIP